MQIQPHRSTLAPLSAYRNSAALPPPAPPRPPAGKDPVDTITLSPEAQQRLAADQERREVDEAFARVAPELAGKWDKLSADGASDKAVSRIKLHLSALEKAGEAVRKKLEQYDHVLEAYGIDPEKMGGFGLTPQGDIVVRTEGKDGEPGATAIIPAKLLGRDADQVRSLVKTYEKERAMLDEALDQVLKEMKKQEEERNGKVAEAIVSNVFGEDGDKKDKGSNAPPVPSDLTHL